MIADSYPRCGVSVEPVVAPPPGNPRFPLFDSLRAIAALSVLLTHVALLAGANKHAWFGQYTARMDVGVAIFFVISGFLLYRPFVAARLDGRRPPRIRDYGRRRILRIVPAYWLALTVLAIYPGTVNMWTKDSWVYYVFIQIYNRNWTLGGLAPAWTLCVEVAFYVALPIVAFSLRAFKGDRSKLVRNELLLLAALFAGSLLVRALTTGHQVQVQLPAQFDWFVYGMALAVVSAALAGREPNPVQLLRRFPGIAWIAAGICFWVISTQFNIGGEAFEQV